MSSGDPPDDWLRHRTFAGTGFDADRLVALKEESATRVSVVLPARDVADTVGAIVDAVRREWMGRRPLVDELLVMDSDSTDATSAAAAAAGADVVRAGDVLPHMRAEPGKGEALWKSLAVVGGDVVVWLDADVRPFDPAFVSGLLGPLLEEPSVHYVKAFYRRDHDGRRGEGGRVTEICARPLINLLYPELAVFAQPLAGEAAGRTAALRRVPFFTGYAVEAGLLVDLSRMLGLSAIAQVDLGHRRHPHQSTVALGRMGFEIARALLARAADGPASASMGSRIVYHRPQPAADGVELRSCVVPMVERPPMDRVRPTGR